MLPFSPGEQIFIHNNNDGNSKMTNKKKLQLDLKLKLTYVITQTCDICWQQTRSPSPIGWALIPGDVTSSKIPQSTKQMSQLFLSQFVFTVNDLNYFLDTSKHQNATEKWSWTRITIYLDKVTNHLCPKLLTLSVLNNQCNHSTMLGDFIIY